MIEQHDPNALRKEHHGQEQTKKTFAKQPKKMLALPNKKWLNSRFAKLKKNSAKARSTKTKIPTVWGFSYVAGAGLDPATSRL